MMFIERREETKSASVVFVALPLIKMIGAKSLLIILMLHQSFLIVSRTGVLVRRDMNENLRKSEEQER